jgi:hypothetical protein
VEGGRLWKTRICSCCCSMPVDCGQCSSNLFVGLNRTAPSLTDHSSPSNSIHLLYLLYSSPTLLLCFQYSVSFTNLLSRVPLGSCSRRATASTMKYTLPLSSPTVRLSHLMWLHVRTRPPPLHLFLTHDSLPCSTAPISRALSAHVVSDTACSSTVHTWFVSTNLV